ncbi:MAG: hypothetical protein BECKG1743F_GA0114225_112451, partial [Candidatus Kentron sp. G]
PDTQQVALPLREKAAKQHYSIGDVQLFLKLVLEGGCGLRTVSRVLSVIGEFLGLPTDVASWYSGRLWLMRVGYYKLTAPKIQAEDWIWIVDFSIQLGKEKCLVILGIRQSDMPPVGQALRHEDMEAITVEPVKQANGDIVWKKLEEAVGKTGVPRAIVSDRGTDLKAGIEQFCQTHQKTAMLYDIKHKIALMLKRYLEKDERWSQFVDYAHRLKKQLQQTDYGYLAPPALRAKARYMNLEGRIAWAQKALTLLDSATEEKELLEEKLGELENHQQPVEKWAEMLKVATTTEYFVSTKALSPDLPVELALHFKELPRLEFPETRRFRHELIKFIRTQAFQCCYGSRYFGGSVPHTGRGNRGTSRQPDSAHGQ